MIQTHYVRLEPPYEIIFCNGEVGVQIGCLIAVEEKRGENDEYGLVTHTHPIVCYGAKDILNFWTSRRTNVWTSPGDYVQGAVWDKVEVKDILVLGLLDDKKPWALNEEGFSELLCRMYEAKIQQGQSINNAFYYLHRNLRLLGISPHYKPYSDINLKIQIIDYLEIPYVMMSNEESTVLLSIPLGSLDDMVEETIGQIRAYESLAFNDYGAPQWHFEYSYETCPTLFEDGKPGDDNELLLKNLVKVLKKTYGDDK
jgi:hypothetical protein